MYDPVGVACVAGLFLGAGLNPHPGRFNAIKAKLRCIFWLFYLLGIIHLRFAVADEPEKGGFNAILS
jgi:hypothetical protein